MTHRDIRTQDPDLGDVLLVDEERYEVLERCPCGPDTQHIRWFLQGNGTIAGVRFPQEAVLAKEWEGGGEFWWWFGRRIALSDLRAGRRRFMDTLERDHLSPPKRLFYEGRLYHQALASEPLPVGPTEEESIPIMVWEYVDAEETESILLEVSAEAEAVAYHGAYYDPELIRTLE